MKLIWPFDSTMVEKWMVNAFRCYTEIVKENKNHKFKNIPHINSARIVEPPENSWSLAPIVNSKKIENDSIPIEFHHVIERNFDHVCVPYPVISHFRPEK